MQATVQAAVLTQENTVNIIYSTECSRIIATLRIVVCVLYSTTLATYRIVYR